MGLALRYFLVSSSGKLERMAAKRWHRAMKEEGALPEYRAQNLKVLEIVVQVDRRTVTAVLRVLPFRMVVRGDGSLDVRGHGRLAMERLSRAFRTAKDLTEQIRELELDANYCWEPEEDHWRQLSEAFELPIKSIRRGLYKSPPK